MFTALHCTERFILTPSSSRYDLNTAERDIKHQSIIIIIIIIMKRGAGAQIKKKYLCVMETNAVDVTRFHCTFTVCLSQEDNFCDFLLPFLHPSFFVSERRIKYFYTVVSVECVFIPLKQASTELGIFLFCFVLFFRVCPAYCHIVTFGRSCLALWVQLFKTNDVVS